MGEALIMSSDRSGSRSSPGTGYNWLTRRNKAVMEEDAPFASLIDTQYYSAVKLQPIILLIVT